VASRQVPEGIGAEPRMSLPFTLLGTKLIKKRRKEPFSRRFLAFPLAYCSRRAGKSASGRAGWVPFFEKRNGSAFWRGILLRKRNPANPTKSFKIRKPQHFQIILIFIIVWFCKIWMISARKRFFQRICFAKEINQIEQIFQISKITFLIFIIVRFWKIWMISARKRFKNKDAQQLPKAVCRAGLYTSSDALGYAELLRYLVFFRSKLGTRREFPSFCPQKSQFFGEKANSLSYSVLRRRRLRNPQNCLGSRALYFCDKASIALR
jgi:hypothetical protein